MSTDSTDQSQEQAVDLDYESRLEQAKGSSAGQLLFKAARLWNEAAVAKVASLGGAQGAAGLRVAHTAVFPHLDLDGTRATVLAERMGISKQAVGRLVDDLEEMGVVARVPDSRDGRALLVCFTDKGRAAMLHGLGVLTEMEHALAEAVGPADMDALRGTLIRLIEALQAQNGPSQPESKAPAP